VYRDVGGAIAVATAILALRRRSRAAIPLVSILLITTLATVLNISDGIRENLFGAATAVTWMIVSFYGPIPMVTLGLISWQLYSREARPLTLTASSASVPPRRLSLAD
jgi:hypothetical protein